MTSSPRWLRGLSLAVSGLGVLGGASPVFAAETTVAGGLEEVTVTARKREETLQDAPVAITAISERQLEQYNIVLMEDIASLAGGGVLISKNGVSPTLSIRGVSSDATNAGFDQSVGIIIDGVFYDRSRWTQMGFFDVGQVEVLKGPQSLYFGKSTVAGALVMSTANPTDKFYGKASVGYEMEGREIYGEGVIAGPIGDNVGARLAVRASSMEGWLKNDAPVITSKRFGGSDDYNARFTLAWNPSDTVKVNWKVQANKTKDDGPATRAQLYNCRGPSPFGTTITGIQGNVQGAPFFAAYAPTDDCKLNDRITVYPGPPGLEFAQKPFNDTNAALSSLKIDWKVGNFSITSVTGANTYDLDEATGYISSQGLISAQESERNTGISQELRALSNLDGPVNFLFGANYAHTDFRFRNASQIILAIPDRGRAASQDHVAKQTAKSFSVFGEVDWDITSQVQLSAGARYTDEKKDSSYDLTFVNRNFVTIFGFPFWLPEGMRLANKFKDTNTSPQATLQWKPQDGLNLFVSYKTGFLPGGFSLGATPQAGLTLKDFLFESEKVKGYEVGLKKTALNGALNFDVIAYDYKFTNQQVNLYVPATASFVVGNAGEAKTRGVEFGARWQATDSLNLRGSATYNKGTFQDYRTACWTLQTAAQGCVNGAQNMTGKPLPRAPKYTASLGGLYVHPLSDRWNLNLSADAFYSDKYQLEQTASPFLVQDSYVRFDASIAVESADRAWRVALFGRNLGNEIITSFGATRGFTNDQLAEIQRLRTVTLELTRTF